MAHSSASRDAAEEWYRLTQRAEDEQLAPDLVGIMRDVLELGKQIGRRELLAELRRRH